MSHIINLSEVVYNLSRKHEKSGAPEEVIDKISKNDKFRGT